MLEKDFCNPHQLVRDERKLQIRKKLLPENYSKQSMFTYLNTVETPEKSLDQNKKPYYWLDHITELLDYMKKMMN